MAEREKNFFSDYESGIADDQGTSSGSYVDNERDYPIESRCCISGDDVKHSYCRHPDSIQGTMMVMSRESMLRFVRPGKSLSEEFERVLELRRKSENRKKA
ncbi:MAG: hypothetical protein O2954_19770 [bacterium]|nr:hypothetical protein [bacterium]